MGILAGNRGGGMRNNRLLILLVLAVVALVLHYCNRQPADDKGRPPAGRTIPPADDVATDARPETTPRRPRSNAADLELDPYLPAPTPDGDVVRHKAYALDYAADYGQARWVLHRVLGKGGNAKRSNKFMPDPLVAKSPLPSDYTRSGYDRGHMAPAGDFKYDQEATNESFYMTNMSPQDHALNIGLWNDIEEQVRRWAKKRGSLVVVTGPVLRPGLPAIGRSVKVAVPERYFKIVYDPARQQAIAFLVENRNYPQTDLPTVTTSVDDVERATGLDFFARLPEATQRAIEARHEPDDWF